MHVSGWNVALQVVNFVVLAWLLQRFLFSPVRAALAKRQEAIEASLRAGDAKAAEAARALEDYRARSAAVAAQAGAAREQALAEAEVEAARLREEAGRRAEAELARARTDVERERADALRVLEERAAALATSIAGRLLADALPDSDAPFLARTMASIDALEPASKATLGKQLAAGRVEIVSSRPLDALSRARVEPWLASLAGKPVSTSYLVDAGLIAGVELRLPSGVWRFHWRAAVERVRQELVAHVAAA